ncbi:hypothetical protein [Cupriavidus sp.]|uniref:hypothetical protein n=1 Tax=Cupriavidus sp. TaxID=1873897 RepID=UPI0028BE6385|nr:hypothetical protein [Cupriavidus sp.]
MMDDHVEMMPAAEIGAMSIKQFCSRYGINRDTLLKLRRDGLGPDEIHAGRKILITYRAAAEWEVQMAARARSEKHAARPLHAAHALHPADAKHSSKASRNRDSTATP